MIVMPTAALLVAGLLGVVLPASTRTVTEYDVRFGPLRLLELRATIAIDGGRYQAESHMRTVGMAGVLFPWTSRANTEGRLEPERLRPIRHLGRGEFRGQQRAVVIDYREAGEVSAVVEPRPEQDARDAVPAALQQRTIDPLTATLAAIAFDCRGTLPVFDGRRRYDMRLRDMGEADVPAASNGTYRGRARHCRAEIHSLAGLRRDGDDDERPAQLDYWIAAPRADAPAVPVYLELSAPRGTLAIELTKVEAVQP
jgi:hypothetical protein